MHVTKIVRFDWSAVFGDSVMYGTKNLHVIELRSIRYKFLVQAS